MYSNGPSVAVILPTYNGEKYLEATLRSIFAQTYSNFTIFIRDDGSSDGTRGVISRIADDRENQDRIVVIEDGKGNLGCPDSFYQIIRGIPAFDYYAFCDQDDIWLPSKLEFAIEKLSTRAVHEPLVYFSCFEYRTSSGEFIRRALRQDDRTSLAKTLFYTPGLGFTIVFNRSACDAFVMDVDCGRILQDRWMLRCGAAMGGGVVYDPRVTAWHIRHNGAVTAADNTHRDLLENFLRNELRGNDTLDCEATIAHFVNVFSDRLKDTDKRILERFSRPSRGLGDRLGKVFYPARFRQSFMSELLLRLIFLVGKS